MKSKWLVILTDQNDRAEFIHKIEFKFQSIFQYTYDGNENMQPDKRNAYVKVKIRTNYYYNYFL